LKYLTPKKIMPWLFLKNIMNSQQLKYEPIEGHSIIPASNRSGVRKSLEVDQNTSSFRHGPEGIPTNNLNSSSRVVSPESCWWVFWILGLLNNASYVIMLACAKSISEGGTALVFLANIVPSLGIKLSAPYWFEKASYKIRLTIASLSMTLSFMVVASSHWVSPKNRLGFQLLGVCLASSQCGLGEASLLALAGKIDSWRGSESPTSSPNERLGTQKGYCLTSFSSGTGLAGVFGFFWKWLFNDWMGFQLSTTLWMALLLPFTYFGMFRSHFWAVGTSEKMSPRLGERLGLKEGRIGWEEESEVVGIDEGNQETGFEDEMVQSLGDEVITIDNMTGREKFKLVLTLWPYMTPLFLVYAAEYALQAGTWTAIGLPDLDSEYDRDRFFEFSNWMYQAGVFLSRSSGTLFTSPMWLLWLMPVLQSFNVALFSFFALNPSSLWYSGFILYPLCFYVGLLGGAVYISGYKRICEDIVLEYREFSLAATSVAEGAGVMVADILGLVIQACIYQSNALDGAVATCPLVKRPKHQ
jgi:battenin